MEPDRSNPEEEGKVAPLDPSGPHLSSTLRQSVPDSQEYQYASGNRPDRAADIRRDCPRASSPDTYVEYGTTHRNLSSRPSLALQTYYKRARDARPPRCGPGT